MKTLQRALNLTVGAVIACWAFDKDKIEAGILICLMLVVILPIAYHVCGDDDEQQ